MFLTSCCYVCHPSRYPLSIHSSAVSEITVSVNGYSMHRDESPAFAPKILSKLPFIIYTAGLHDLTGQEVEKGFCTELVLSLVFFIEICKVACARDYIFEHSPQFLQVTRGPPGYTNPVQIGLKIFKRYFYNKGTRDGHFKQKYHSVVMVN